MKVGRKNYQKSQNN